MRSKEKRLLNELKKWIQKNYGKKCPDYHPFCTVCVMWHAYETVAEGFNIEDD